MIKYQIIIYWSEDDQAFIAEVPELPRCMVEVARAGAQGKPVLALYQPREGRRLSALIAGDPNVTVVEYISIEDAISSITKYFKE